MKSRIYIESFDCVTSTGENPNLFWNALILKKSGLNNVDITCWPPHFIEYWKNQNHQPIACKISNSIISYSESLSDHLCRVALNTLGQTSISEPIGIIYASTKGSIEDFIWNESLIIDNDPLDHVLSLTINKLPKYNWKYKQTVSNSCASSHAAISLAQKWISSGECSKVLIIAGDLIGPFIHTGFQTLKALSVEKARPFSSSRDGLVLGEAMTAILFTKNKSSFELLDCQIFNEAHTVTGASPEGRGLFECIKRLRVNQEKPDFAIAHGTATILNDQVEDIVMAKAQKFFNKNFPITGTKWSIGHTLGASGSVDLIAAMMSLKFQEIFTIPQGEEIQNPSLIAKNYLFKECSPFAMNSALITSLGFGGTNAALMVKRHN